MSFHAAVRPSVNCKQKERLEENSSSSEADELDREQADVEEQVAVLECNGCKKTSQDRLILSLTFRLVRWTGRETKTI